MKTHLTIGAGPGISFATAERFAKEGLKVVLASRSGEKLAAHVEALRKRGVAVEVATVDAADPQSVVSLVQRYASELSVVHYNAGVLHYGADGQLQSRALEQETVESLENEINIGLVSALATIRAAAEAMTPRAVGTILLTGGGFGVEPSADFINISVAKAGLRAAVKALFEPMKKKGIHIATVTVATLVSPGSAKATEVGDAFWHLHEQPKADWSWEEVVG
jgi:short-subunit dehydrogenase